MSRVEKYTWAAVHTLAVILFYLVIVQSLLGAIVLASCYVVVLSRSIKKT